MRKNNFFNFNFSLFALTFFIATVSAFSQEEESETEQDSTKTGYRLGQIQMQNPNSIVSKYTYDPVLDRYLYTEMIGDVNVSYPMMLTREEYQELVLEERMKEYFKEKSDALSGRDKEAEAQQKNLLPIFYVDNQFFESVFGGSEIEVIPQGSVEVDLGVLYSKQDNPSLSPRNRSSLTFDFDQRISLSLLGTVGTRLQVTANYDTESTFDFQNQIKLEYTPDEDDIVRKIEVGNVSMPITNSLIDGSQSLFGVKTELQFGKTTITGVFSEQNSERTTTTIQGGGSVEEFEKFILDYDSNKHFFLSHYFRDQYNDALANYPFIASNIQVTKVQIWVTNTSNTTDALTDARNIVAIQDLGESTSENIGVLLDANGDPNNSSSFAGFVNVAEGSYPSNANNDFNPLGISGPQQTALTSAIRDIATVDQGFGVHSSEVSEGIDYVKLENARQLSSNEYTLYSDLGYISLNQTISDDEILAVAYQYTVNGQVYQVGEFANDGVEATTTATGSTGDVTVTQNLVVKMLKSTITNVNEPVWDLMMKNIYSLGAYQLEEDNFEFRILYSDPESLNYIKPEGSTPLPSDVQETNLLRVFNLDNLNTNRDPVVGGDGFFDFVAGQTIDVENGRIIFTTVEPFGEYLFNKLDNTPNGGSEDYDDESTYNENQEKYVFRSLYATTKTAAEQEDADKNKFKLEGSYTSSGENGISLGAFNIPQGSVTVTAGGIELQEGIDYTVDYQLGTVTILDEALLASDAVIQASTENNALFGQQTKRYTALDVQHQFNENFIVGATYVNLNERPTTQKSNYGYESINNSIYGLNFNYATEVPFFTRLVNKLPNIDTDVESNFSIRGEFAYLQPGSPSGDDFDGETTSYIDDFEASQTAISLLSPLSWYLSSVPVGYGGEYSNNDLAVNYKRAHLNWYTVDPVFYTDSRPSGVSDDDMSTYATRRVYIDEIYPNTDVVEGQAQVIYTLDMAYYPTQRGPYNFNPTSAGTNDLLNPSENFAGIMRGMTTTDFEQSNVEFVEFWVMDPFIYDENQNVDQGKVVLNFGSISEDILKDGRKQYENGLPVDGSTDSTIETDYGKVPSSQSLVYAFDSEDAERDNQDIGFDGLSDAEEATKFPDFANLEDPANDNYEYYLAKEGNVLERYYNYNGSQGNSPTDVEDDDRGNSTVPSVEDINRDNTMNTIDSYFEYEVPVFRNMSVDNNTSSITGIDEDYITDVKTVTTTMQNGESIDVRWVQFKVPLSTNSEYSVNGISDLRSVRFMRMYLADFADDVVLRLGALNLVRGDYKSYTEAIVPDGTDPESTPGTELDVTAVSEEQTSDYVTPPGVVREELINNNQTIREDEQSLSLTVTGLDPGDSRGVYKSFQVDMRQYENLEMFLHAESLPAPAATLEDGDLTAFIRMGSDFTDNFYQIEIPLTISEANSTASLDVWPEENNLDLSLSLLQEIKSLVLGSQAYSSADLNFFTSDLSPSTSNNLGELRVGIKGNPTYGDIRLIMLGVKNTGDTEASGEVWFNELRLSELKSQGGWAAVLSLDTNFADFANVSASGSKSTIGFGGVEQSPSERSLEDSQQYDVTTNLNLGQLLPKTWGVKVPLSYSIGEELVTPLYDPEYLDIELETLLDNATDEATKDELLERAEDYTKTQSVSVIGLRKERVTKPGKPQRKPMPYDIENFAFSGTYNQVDHRDFEVEDYLSQSVSLGATYSYGFRPFKIEPFKNIKYLDSSEYYKFIKDFNINLLPTSLSVSSNIDRDYDEQTYRETDLTSGSLGLPTLYQRNYTFDWQYTVNHNLTESLRFTFNSSTNRIVNNYINDDNVQDNTVGIWDGFFDLGNPNQLYQSLQLNYDVPFDKIPLLEFIKTQYSYTGNFQWQKGSEINNSLTDIPDLGNDIQNSNTHQLNSTFELKTLYNYLGLKKKPDPQNTRGRSPNQGNRLGFSRSSQKLISKNNDTKETLDKLSVGDKATNTLIGIATAVKRITANYQETNGIYLPGYTNDVGFGGTLKPTTAFVFGSQADVREIAASNGWLTLYQDYNEQYVENEMKTLSLQSQIDLLPDLTIDLNANRTYSETYTENYVVNTDDLQYRSLSSNTYGSFSITNIMIGTAFAKSDQGFSETFEKFRDNRITIANRLAQNAGIDITDPDNLDDDGFPIGFGKSSQAVMLPSFLSAYGGQDANDVGLGFKKTTPLPNWNIKYTGLMRIKWFKDRFRRLSLQHGYSSVYNVNQFQSNLDYDRNAPYSELNKDQSGNFKNEFLISTINLVEQFTPLIKVDMELKNSVSVLAEIRKDRALSLSFDNDLLTEVQGDQYTLGLGYRVKDLKIPTRIGGQPRVLSSDLNFKLDFSFRRNQTIIRYLDTNNSQTTAGQDLWSFNFTTDYALSKNLTAIFYYDHIFSEYAVSTAFPQTTITSGITLRYNFGN
ncbi:protein involved in gliding motility SprA [Mesonia phycicola]|uniref:Protein involved in gliding motility SprA n=1 Tax=Mesonia phycicola TaxID=579105 RepID=A0A1M6EUZ4_9FLAO|nr:cell surface protein SprA [Mesonia phycicola]SHI89265.1 protein involved in gliding motility SprA [Mesonia phycicola]